MPKQRGTIAAISSELGIPRSERKKLEAASEFGAETNRLRQEERRSRESQERRVEQRRIVEQVIEEVTQERIGMGGMNKSDLMRSHMSQYGHTPVRRAEAAPQAPEAEAQTPETDTEDKEAA